MRSGLHQPAAVETASFAKVAKDCHKRYRRTSEDHISIFHFSDLELQDDNMVQWWPRDERRLALGVSRRLTPVELEIRAGQMVELLDLRLKDRDDYNILQLLTFSSTDCAAWSVLDEFVRLLSKRFSRLRNPIKKLWQRIVDL